MTTFFALAAQRLGDDWHCVVQGLDGGEAVFVEDTAGALAVAAANALEGGGPSLGPFLDALRAAVAPDGTEEGGAIGSFVLKVHPVVGNPVWRCEIESNGGDVGTEGASLADAISDALASGAHVRSLVAEIVRGLPDRPWAS